MYHHKTMCSVHSLFRFDVELWPKGQILCILSCLCPTCNFCKLWHWHTIFGSLFYHHEKMCKVHSWPWYDLEVKFIWFMTWLCVQFSGFLSFDIVILCLARECFTMVRRVANIMNSVWLWSLTSILKLYFHHEFESGKMSLLFDIGIPNFGMWVNHH